MEERPQPLVTGIAIISLMPILIDVSVRQFDRGPQNIKVKLTSEDKPNCCRHSYDRTYVFCQKRSGSKPRHVSGNLFLRHHQLQDLLCDLGVVPRPYRRHHDMLLFDKHIQ